MDLEIIRNQIFFYYLQNTTIYIQNYYSYNYSDYFLIKVTNRNFILHNLKFNFQYIPKLNITMRKNENGIELKMCDPRPLHLKVSLGVTEKYQDINFSQGRPSELYQT